MNQKIILNKIIPKVVKKIISAYKPEKIILFGYYAYGNPHDDSDIDLVIIKDTNQTSMQRWLTINEILKDYQDISISPFIYTPKEFQHRLELRDFFILNILKKGKVYHG